ncbi:hypothetical protein [Streptomyces fulvorobeus]|uniref:Peptidase n=1 Tax=Streptomyces fulvorobeus TaxID=284028 RepID=A0A7J0C4E6_9ACTN|nr:hypothetical protein [Streptomyces fulvorobeus]NYE41015.1 hypothetical protein [Streptomyces fulvorobeus]GFM97340.1 hypothetical protein Sfulv_21510 [Streptomyces fulvorobeus]
MPPKPPARPRDGRALITLGTLGPAAGIAAAAVLLVGAPPAGATAPTVSDAGRQPGCGDPDAAEFPIETRIHGGPGTYASGGGYGVWYLDLTNTTSEPCRAVHPVLVLTDQDRRLAADQIQLEFSARTGRADPDAEYRVSWETTDRDEQIGVFGGGAEDEDFAGFTVPAGRTVTVQVRMAFTSGTAPGEVTVSAAVVHRHKGGEGAGDGEWVGESGAYPFVIVDGGAGATADPDSEPGTGTTPRDAAGNPLPELARTGQDPVLPLGFATGVLIIGGAAVVTRADRARREQD